MNLVNTRREFFYATPAEVEDLLIGMGDDHVLEYNDTAEAVEWRASEPGRRGGPDRPELSVERRRGAVLSAVGVRRDSGADGDLSDDGGE